MRALCLSFCLKGIQCEALYVGRGLRLVDVDVQPDNFFFL